LRSPPARTECRNAVVDGTAVYTNNPPCGAMRRFGAPQVCFAHESQMDRLAAAVGILAGAGPPPQRPSPGIGPPHGSGGPGIGARARAAGRVGRDAGPGPEA
jgi:hypothetical protein